MSRRSVGRWHRSHGVGVGGRVGCAPGVWKAFIGRFSLLAALMTGHRGEFEHPLALGIGLGGLGLSGEGDLDLGSGFGGSPDWHVHVALENHVISEWRGEGGWRWRQNSG